MRRRVSSVTLLRWYPRAWRDRYGEEFIGLVQDMLEKDVSVRGSWLRSLWPDFENGATAPRFWGMSALHSIVRKPIHSWCAPRGRPCCSSALHS